MLNLTVIKKVLLLFVIVVMISAPGTALAENDPYAAVKKVAVEQADLLVNQYGVTSLQYALVSEGKVIVSGSAGVYDKRESAALTNSTLYGIGSSSKMFTTAAIMLLKDKGKLDLDRPVTAYLPEFKMADERYRQITVRMLLNHSSGLMGSVYVHGPTYDAPDTRNHDELLAHLATQRLKADPGAFSVYCNDGFTLAELIVERISGLSFSDFINRFISRPLDMYNTKTPQDVFNRAHLARTYIDETETPAETFNMLGTGGIYSTAEDLCRFGEMFMVAPGFPAAALMLSDEAKRLTMQTEYKRGIWPTQTDSMIGYGLGWDTVDSFPFNRYRIQALIKGGDTGLYHSSLIVLPEQNMVVAMVSSGGSSLFGQLMGQTLLLQTLLAEGKINEIKPLISYNPNPPVASAMPEDLAAFAGYYANSSKVMGIHIAKDGTLKVSVLSTPDVPEETYLYTSAGEFVNAEGNKKLTFVQESNGEIYSKIVQYINLEGLGQTVMTYYDGQKITATPVEESVQQAWNERNRTAYFLVNETYTNQSYHSYENISMNLLLNQELPGYVNHYKIIDRDRAIADVQIPGIRGRDTSTLEMVKQNDKNYLLTSGWVYISEKDIPPLDTASKMTCTIEADGYARWYAVKEEDAGRTIFVKMPRQGAFAVYDKDTCVYYSTASGNHPVTLPKNGKVVFIGKEPGDRFEISTK